MKIKETLYCYSFMLLELLAVISVIAILTSLLLPVQNKAKATEKSSLCQSKTKQIYMGCMSYSADSDYLTSSYATTPSCYWMQLLSDYGYLSKSWDTAAPSPFKIYRCPSEHRGNASSTEWATRKGCHSGIDLQINLNIKNHENNRYPQAL